jgi:CRP/FNR family transcriptional regulator, cyclic AMP receptor protein
MKANAQFPLLELLREDEKNRILKNMQMQEVSPETSIYERGDNCTDAFFIFSGKVKFCTFGLRGEMAFFWHRYPGDIFGFYSAITGQRQTTTAIAVETALLGRMSSKSFMDVVLSNPALSEYMLKLVTNMLRAESNRITQLLTMKAPQRVAAAILDYAEASGDTVIHLPARAELASRIGMTRETLARHLSVMSKQGIISLEKDKVSILDYRRLVQVIE